MVQFVFQYVTCIKSYKPFKFYFNLWSPCTNNFDSRAKDGGVLIIYSAEFCWTQPTVSVIVVYRDTNFYSFRFSLELWETFIVAVDSLDFICSLMKIPCSFHLYPAPPPHRMRGVSAQCNPSLYYFCFM